MKPNYRNPEILLTWESSLHKEGPGSPHRCIHSEAGMHCPEPTLLHFNLCTGLLLQETPQHPKIMAPAPIQSFLEDTERDKNTTSLPTSCEMMSFQEVWACAAEHSSEQAAGNSREMKARLPPSYSPLGMGKPQTPIRSGRNIISALAGFIPKGEAILGYTPNS